MKQLELFPAIIASTSRFEIEDTKLLITDVGSCSSAFVQFSPECPHWVLRDVARYMDRGYFKLKTARIVCD